MTLDAKSIFELLVREHAGMLMAYLRAAVRDPSTAEDLFQETMVSAWKSLDRFDRERPMAPWLRGIARNVVLVWYRKNKTAPQPVDASALEVIDHRMAGLQRLSGDTFEEKLSALGDCVSALPEAYRQVIDLRYRDDLWPQQISEQLSQNLEAVKKRLHRARTMLLECLTGKLPAIGDAQ